MMQNIIHPALNTPATRAMAFGTGDTGHRIPAAFARAGIADHMQADVLRSLFDVGNAYPFGTYVPYRMLAHDLGQLFCRAPSPRDEARRLPAPGVPFDDRIPHDQVA